MRLAPGQRRRRTIFGRVKVFSQNVGVQSKTSHDPELRTSTVLLKVSSYSLRLSRQASAKYQLTNATDNTKERQARTLAGY